MPNDLPKRSDRMASIRGREGDRAYDKRRRRHPLQGAAARIRSSARWRKVRAATLRDHPTCVACERAGVRQLATQVDHVVPLVEALGLAFEPSNLEPLCTRCHAIKSQAERRAQCAP